MEVVSVDIFLIELLDLRHYAVIFFDFLRVLQKSSNQLFGPIGVEEGESLVHYVGLCVFLLISDTWFIFIYLYIK